MTEETVVRLKKYAKQKKGLNEAGRMLYEQGHRWWNAGRSRSIDWIMLSAVARGGVYQTLQRPSNATWKKKGAPYAGLHSSSERTRTRRCQPCSVACSSCSSRTRRPICVRTIRPFVLPMSPSVGSSVVVAGLRAVQSGHISLSQWLDMAPV